MEPTNAAGDLGQHRVGPDLLEKLLDYVQTHVRGCLGVGLTAAGERPRPLVTIGIATQLDAWQWHAGTGPTTHTVSAQEPTVSPDITQDERWPELAERVRTLTDVASQVAVMTASGSWDDEGPVVLSVYLDHEPTPHDLQGVEGIEPVLATAAALVEHYSTEALRADQLIKMVQHRRTIEQAKGLVMGELGCAAPEAFNALVRASQRFNVKLRELTVALVELVTDTPAENTTDELLAPYAAEPSPPERPSAAARQAAKDTWLALRSGRS
ncbi:MAG: ANTAR domain-containing protein [Pseudonocardiaceae bacterium]|nr:ANTAR domain-containing protein [Pseudonocardiaceae bacterium]